MIATSHIKHRQWWFTTEIHSTVTMQTTRASPQWFTIVTGSCISGNINHYYLLCFIYNVYVAIRRYQSKPQVWVIIQIVTNNINNNIIIAALVLIIFNSYEYQIQYDKIIYHAGCPLQTKIQTVNIGCKERLQNYNYLYVFWHAFEIIITMHIIQSRTKSTYWHKIMTFNFILPIELLPLAQEPSQEVTTSQFRLVGMGSWIRVQKMILKRANACAYSRVGLTR